MKPHTPDQILGLTKYADSQPQGKEHKTYTLNGIEVVYSIVHLSDDTKPFDYAVAAFVVPPVNGEPITEADYKIAVNDDVPEELQGLWAWHELHDFAILGHEAENRCLTSEQQLLASLSADSELYQSYIAIRIPFYVGLAAFIDADLKQKGDKSVYSVSDLDGCYDALRFLQSQIQLASS